MTYLSVWQSTLTTAQEKQLRRLLSRLQQDAAYSPEELRQEVARLVARLTTDAAVLQPRYAAQPDALAASEDHNLNLSGLAGDTETVFTELLHLAQLQRSFQYLYDSRILAELRALLQALDAVLMRQRYLAYNPLGFSHSLDLNFSYQTQRTTTEHELGALFYRDHRRGLPLSLADMAVADYRSRGLTLPVRRAAYLRLGQVRLLSVHHTSNQLASRTIGQLENILDGQDNTFWLQEIYCDQPSATGVEMTLEMEVGGSTPVTCLELHPIADYPVLVKSLAILVPRHGWVELTDQYPVLQSPLQQPVRLHLPSRHVRRSRLTLQQLSYRRVRLPGQDNLSREAYLYTLGLDNFMLGQVEFKPLGVYVSPMLATPRCRLVAVEDEVSCPPECSVEYYLVKRDYGAQNVVLQTALLPVLPLRLRQVSREALPLTTTTHSVVPDTGMLRFPCALEGEHPVQIYEEHRQLQPQEYTWETAAGGAPMRLRIHHAAANLYYSVSYTPVHLLTMQPYYLDSGRQHWLSGNNAIHCQAAVSGQEVELTHLWLVILLRANPRWPHLTPIVHRCQLLTTQP